MKTKYFKYAEDLDPNYLVRTVGIRINASSALPTTYKDIEDVVVEAMGDFSINRNNIRIVCHDGKRDWRGYIGIEFEVLDTTVIPNDYTFIKKLGPLLSAPLRHN